MNEGSSEIQNLGSNASEKPRYEKLTTITEKIKFLFYENTSTNENGKENQNSNIEHTSLKNPRMARNIFLIQKILSRLSTFAGYDDEIYICAMIYLDKLLKFQVADQKNSSELEMVNPFRNSDSLRSLISICVFLAGKMYSGQVESLKLRDFSKIVGISEDYLAKMECLLTTEVFQWKLRIDSDYFRVYKSRLENLF